MSETSPTNKPLVDQQQHFSIFESETSSTPSEPSLLDEFEIKTVCFKGFWAWLVLIFLIACGIAFFMFLLRKFIQGPVYCKSNRIDGKVVIITGCNTGIGKETALELARRGGKIYMACRDAARCEAARLEIIQRSHNQQVFNCTLDLGSLASVRAFVDRFKTKEQRLDLLINNAGVMACPRQLTVDGFEQQFGVNHLGHFLLTNLLLDLLRASAPSRIVVVSSAAYLFGRINKEDLMSEKNYSKFFGAYSQSKLANILFTRKLAELLRNTGVTVNCCHPGVVRTELNRHFAWPDWVKSVMKVVSLYFFKSPKAGAQTSLRLALDPALEKSTGGYYSDSMRFPLMPWAKNEQVADWLWQESEKLVGLASSSSPPTHPASAAQQQQASGGTASKETTKTGSAGSAVSGGSAGVANGDSVVVVNNL